MLILRFAAICILLIGGLLTAPRPVVAQDPSTWQPTFGPPGGTINSFVTLRDNVVLAGSNRGVYLSIDNGINWTYRSEGFITDDVRTLMVTPTGAVFAGTNQGLYRSMDTGLTWSLLDTGLESPSFTALTQGSESLYAGGPNGVIESKDNGETWELINNGLIDPRINTLEFTQEGDVLAGTEEGVFQLGQLSDSWDEVNEGLNRFTDRIINAIRQYDDRRLLAGTASGVFITDADFISWSPLIGELGGEDGSNIIALDVDPAGVIFAATPRSVYRSEDEGINWDLIVRGLPPIGSPVQIINSIHLSTNNDLLAGTAYYGVYRFFASNEQWESSTEGLATQTVSSIAITTFGDVLAGTDTGLFASIDLGASWEHTFVQEDASGFELLHQDELERIFANGSSLLMSEDQGISWFSIRGETASAFYVLEDNTFIANFDQSNRVFRSVNEGETWLEAGQIPSQTALFRVHAFLEDNQERVYAATSEGLFRSSDQGVSWETIPLGSAPDEGRSIARDNAGHVYVGGGKGLYRSDVNGDNLELILEAETGVQEVLVQSQNIYLAVTASEGIYRTVNGGADWMPLNDGLPVNAELITAVLDSTTIADALGAYVSVRNGGIYQGAGVIQLSSEASSSVLLEDIKVSTFPNPFIEKVTIEFDVATPQHIQLEIFDLLGRKIETLLNAPVRPGRMHVEWHSKGLPGGLYFIRITMNTRSTVWGAMKVR